MDDNSSRPKRKHGMYFSGNHAALIDELTKRRNGNSDTPSTSDTCEEPSSSNQLPKKEYERSGEFLFSEGREEDEMLYGHIRRAIKNYYGGVISLDELAQTVTVGVACRVGDVILTRTLLEAGLGGFPDDRGWFPMHEAAFGLHIDCCRVLIESGRTNLDAQAHDGVTPLLLVCSKRCDSRKACELAELMLDHGADVNRASLDGMTPLIQAIRSQNTELVNLLLEHNADPTITWYGNWSALHEAACRHDAETMKRLLDMGLDIFVIDDEHHTPLLVAVQERSIPCVRLALEAAKERAAELANICLIRRNVSCVMAAVSEGYDDVLEILIRYGANCNLIMDNDWGTSSDGRKGMHPITQAALRGFSRCLDQLLPHIDKSILETTEIGPMTGAAYSGAYRCIELLLNAGYPTEEFACSPMDAMIIPYLRPLFVREYYTPLREAVRKGHTRSVQLLIVGGAKMVYTRQCASPFLFSFRNRLDPDILRCFLEHDVDLNFISENSDYEVPDALLSILGTDNREKLLLLLLCGLKPCLEHWCACHNRKGLSLLKNVSQFDYVWDLRNLVSLLAAFSTVIPNCCTEVSDLIGIEPQTGSLSQICRVEIRRSLPPSVLLDNRWMGNIGRFPSKLKGFLKFSAQHRRFM